MQLLKKSFDGMEEMRARQARSAQAEERILGAAEQVFAQAGFAGATMAALARAAGLPAANLHYHFGTKQSLYEAVLENILRLWLDAADGIVPQAHPQLALPAYIRAKMAHSRQRPFASKVFANEVLHGAAHLRSYLGRELRRRVEEKDEVVRGWIARGWMQPTDAKHLFFLLWAMTQTYADFDVQICGVLGRKALTAADYEAGEALIIRLVLRGCGIEAPEGEDNR